MTTHPLTILLSALGALGALGVLGVPVRACQLLFGGQRWRSMTRGTLAMNVVLVIALVFAAAAGVSELPRVHRCLMDSTRCGPNAADGMLHLAMFGIGVLVVEVSWLVAGAMRRRTTTGES